MRRQRGQASLEVIAGVPVLLLAALVALQLLVTGHAASLADGAAEAGALAAAAGRPAGDAARAALPGWARGRAEVDVRGGRVAVALRPPAALPGIAGALTVHATAWARPAPEAP